MRKDCSKLEIEQTCNAPVDDEALCVSFEELVSVENPES